jgi:hypothetical protein
MFKSKKIGKIRVTLQIINDRPEVAQLLFSVFIPLHAVIMPEGWIEYIGICDLFEERQEGLMTPEYDFTIKTDSTGKMNISEVTKV